MIEAQAIYRSLPQHITDMSFGLVDDVVTGKSRSMLLEVLSDLSANNPDFLKLSSIDKQIALSESYAVTYGLMQPDDPNPLSLVCDTHIEGLDSLSGWDLRIDQYTRLRIGENFKLSITDFLNLPRRLITRLIDKAEQIESLESKKRAEAEALLKKQLEENQTTNYPTGFQHTIPKI